MKNIEIKNNICSLFFSKSKTIKLSLLLILFLSCLPSYTQDMKFLGVSFGSDARTFISELQKKNFAIVEWMGDKTEMEGDFWKEKKCTIYLYSTRKESSSGTVFPCTEAWVILPTRERNKENFNIQKEEATQIYKELISDFVQKYGEYTKKYLDSTYGDHAV